MDLCEFEANLVYKASSKKARAVTKKSCLEKKRSHPPKQKGKKARVLLRLWICYYKHLMMTYFKGL